MEALREDRLSRNLKRSGAEMAEFAGTCAPCSAGSAAVACTSGRACAPCSAGSAAVACKSGRACAPCSAGSAAVACTSGRACAPCSAGSAAAACTSGRICALEPARPIPGRDVQEELGSEIWLGAG
jgi:hypothetical protein